MTVTIVRRRNRHILDLGSDIPFIKGRTVIDHHLDRLGLLEAARGTVVLCSITRRRQTTFVSRTINSIQCSRLLTTETKLNAMSKSLIDSYLPRFRKGKDPLAGFSTGLRLGAVSGAFKGCALWASVLWRSGGGGGGGDSGRCWDLLLEAFLYATGKQSFNQNLKTYVSKDLIGRSTRTSKTIRVFKVIRVEIAMRRQWLAHSVIHIEHHWIYHRNSGEIWSAHIQVWNQWSDSSLIKHILNLNFVAPII